MKIFRSILGAVFSGLLLLILLFAVGRTDDLYLDAGSDFPYSEGTAAGEVRSEILGRLRDFQDGYTRRDPDQAEAFVARLFAPEDILILGTMPDEIFIGREEAAELIESDWKYWGDCRFLIDNAHISAAGPVAWFSTRGTVRMDVVKVVLPLRLSGVLVEEDSVWRFQQLQFQFDLALGFLMLVIGLLLGWLIVNFFLVLYHILRALRKRAASNDLQNA